MHVHEQKFDLFKDNEGGIQFSKKTMKKLKKYTLNV